MNNVIIKRVEKQKLHHNAKDYTGEKFGSLLLIERLNKYDGKTTYYKCLCDCGNKCIKRGNSIVRKMVSSCGCNWHNRGTSANKVSFDDKFAYIEIKGCDEPAIIDKEDYEKVKDYHWNRNNLNYVLSKTKKEGREATSLHRLIMGIENKSGDIRIDHIDGNPLNNTKSNLRICSQKEN